MMTAHASTIPAPCPQCGYDVREVAGELCPNCGRRLARQDGLLVPATHWSRLLKSLVIRMLIALPLAFALTCVSVWASSMLGTAKMQATPGIILGVIFGWGFGFGLAERANRVSPLVFILVALTIIAIVGAAVYVAHLAFGSMLAGGVGSKRFWFAAGAFGGTTIMCAILALGHESRSTILR